jgi:hypothetical protein
MASDAPIHPVLAEEVEHALEPYRSLLSADDLAMFRSVLTEQLANDPMIARLVRRAGEAPSVDRSNEIPLDGAPMSEPSTDKVARGSRRRAKG